MLDLSSLIRQAGNLNQRFTTSITKDISLGRLVVIPDKEGKSRNIFMGDYYTQSVFRPIHKVLMTILRKIPEDYTYRQNQSAETINRWIEAKYDIFGFDLSSATERFPLSLQKVVLSRVFGKELSEH